ncbi:ATP-binding protein [Actinorhabdospora filicis]|nr:ATP-binding protein [Actinorhabdospora filicis]
MPVVRVSFTPAPAHVRTVRLVAGAAAQQAGVRGEALDEVRFAVGEACAQAVARHQRHGLREPVRLECEGNGGGFTVRVSDRAPAGESADPVAMALLSGLVSDLRTTPGINGVGTTVVLHWR